jgi:hypothetical protein
MRKRTVYDIPRSIENGFRVSGLCRTPTVMVTSAAEAAAVFSAEKNGIAVDISKIMAHNVKAHGFGPNRVFTLSPPSNTGLERIVSRRLSENLVPPLKSTVQRQNAILK